MRLALLLLLLVSLARAEDIYVSQNAAGADNGTSEANSKGFSWLNDISNWGSGAGKISAGDALHLCGRFTNTVNALGSGTPGNRISIVAEPSCNFVLSGVWTVGLFLWTNSFIGVYGSNTFYIEWTNNGTGLAYTNSTVGVYGVPAIGDIEVVGVRSTNNFVHLTSDTLPSEGVGGQGVGFAPSVGVTNIWIRQCHMSMVEHGARITAATSSGRNAGYYIVSNTFDRCTHGCGGGLGGANAHIDGLYIYGNREDQNGVWQQANNAFHLNGLYYFSENSQVNSYISNVFIFNNRIGPMANVTDNTSAYLFLSASITGDARVVNVYVFNNILFGSTFALGKIMWWNVWHSKSFNNTLNSANGNGVRVSGGTDHVLWNNIISGAETSFYGSGLDFTAWALEFKFNNYADNGGHWGANGDPTTYWTNWIAAGGYNYDQGSNTNDCQYVNEGAYNFNIPAGTNTAASGTGTNLTAWATGIGGALTNALRDIEGRLRPASAPWSMGAYEPNYVNEAAAQLGPQLNVSGTLRVGSILRP